MCGTATWWARLALLCVLIALILQIAGVASNHWMTYESAAAELDQDIGLWRQKNCTAGVCENSAIDSSFLTDEFLAVRALETIVLLAMVVLTIMIAAFVIAEGTRVQNFAIIITVVSFLTGLLSLLGMIVWMSTVPSPYIASFSMGLTVIAFLLVFIAGSLFIFEVLEPQEPYLRRSDSIIPYTPRGAPYAPRGAPYTPRDRRNVITPISYRSGGYSDGSKWYL